MKLFKTLVLLLMSAVLFLSCEKEYSEENGGGGGMAAGTLKAAGTGECLPSTVSGNYIAGTALTANNFINVTVDFTTAGAYTITSNVVNGYSFSGTGIATSAGVQTVKLTGTGTPTADGLNTFTIQYGTSQCNIVVDVYPTGTGNAVLTVDCSGFVLGGTYQQNTPMANTNTVQVEVNTTTAGLYNITTNTVNGVTFSGSGFLAVGTQMVTLTASGTPTTSGVKTYTVTAGTSTCNFNVDYAVGTTPPPTGTAIITCKINGVASTFNVGATAILDNSIGVPSLLIFGQTTASANPSISLGLTKGTGGAIVAGTYTVNQATAGILLGIDYIDAGGVEYFAGTDILNQSQNPAFEIVIQSITATRVKGTFKGPVKDNDGAGPGVKTITEGVFDVPF